MLVLLRPVAVKPVAWDIAWLFGRAISLGRNGVEGDGLANLFMLSVFRENVKAEDNQDS